MGVAAPPGGCTRAVEAAAQAATTKDAAATSRQVVDSATFMAVATGRASRNRRTPPEGVEGKRCEREASGCERRSGRLRGGAMICAGQGKAGAAAALKPASLECPLPAACQRGDGRRRASVSAPGAAAASPGPFSDGSTRLHLHTQSGVTPRQNLALQTATPSSMTIARLSGVHTHCNYKLLVGITWARFSWSTGLRVEPQGGRSSAPTGSLTSASR